MSIYDTKDIFVKELHVLLAQRLLSITDYSLDKEVFFLHVDHMHPAISLTGI